ncbi:MAG: DNA polymerase I, partial [Clostridia bacterium]|nr:DNA polymerase I [Clostridia bacterium]
DPQISMTSLLGEAAADNGKASFDRLFAIEALAEKMADEIEENGQHSLYYDIELPLTEVLARLQLRGMYVDKAELTDFGKMLDERISERQAQIYAEAGEEFNINSPKQLGVILFEKLGLPYGKKTKKGTYSTNIDIMEKLRDKHPIVNMVLEYRQLTKLKSTYVTGLSNVVNPNTGRIHSHFNQMVTNTGRLSSTEPNLQNIPVRTELGREIRKMFIAEKDGRSLIDADYSQIELRVLAHIADDAAMKQAFLDNEDIHTQTAANVFNIPPEQVTPLMRSRAKAVNFGIVYGIGAFSLAQDIGTSRAEAQRYIDDYLAHYSGVAKYMREVVERAKEDGYITTVLGRRRYLPELKASSHLMRAFGERVAMNAPIQGSAADIIKIAMVNVDRRLKSEGLSAKLILQVHDELIVEAPDDEVDAASRILKEEMENAYKLSVPLVVDMNSGKSWYDTK